VLFLHGAQLVLQSSVLTVLDFEVNVTLEWAEIFWLVLSGEGSWKELLRYNPLYRESGDIA
jgi:hypothetical protein